MRFFLPRIFSLFLSVFWVLGAVRGHAAEQKIVTVSVGSEPGRALPDDFLGLSYETAIVLPQNGQYYFSPENDALIRMFHTLGVKHLRIGGNTADRATVPIPAREDIDQLFGFAKAAGVKVIYTLRMKNGNYKEGAEIAKYIASRYPAELSCFALGNEPNVFYADYPAYRQEWEKFRDVIIAQDEVPDAKFCGPSATPGKKGWSHDFAQDIGPEGHLAYITQHHYPGGDARKVTDISAARTSMLSEDWHTAYQRFYDAFVPAVLEKKLTFRLEEANSFFSGGAAHASDAFASSLWALDYLYWWASHDAAGINFHTLDQIDPMQPRSGAKYITFRRSEKGYAARPIGYGIKAFELAGKGEIVPATVGEGSVTAYAIRGTDRKVTVTLINRDLAMESPETIVHLNPGSGFSSGEVQFLTGPANDASAETGVTIGKAEIAEDGSWNGTWTALDPKGADDLFTVKLPPASAAVIRFSGP